jgi:alpha-tubulin suppressor-like RCC1 family protein
VFAWGYNNNGQLGDGSTTNRPSPILLTDANGEAITGIAALAAGGSHSLALKANGMVLAWGYNGSGQLGDGTSTQRQRASAVLDRDTNLLTNIVAIAAGGDHSLAATADGQALAWGYNASGQLGNNTTINYYLPQLVITNEYVPLQGVLSVAAGRIHSLAHTADGHVYSWGDNDNGQLGNGEWFDSYRAQRVIDATGATISDMVFLATKRDHSLAMKSDGILLSWGDNAYNQLGDGSSTDRYTAVVVTDEIGDPIEFLVVQGTYCAGDYDYDGDIDGLDFSDFVLDFSIGNLAADLNNDGVVDGQDVDLFTANFGSTACP